MNNISILEKTRDYVVIKIPRRFLTRFDNSRTQLTEDEAARILKSGMAEYRKGKTKTLVSLRELRNGDWKA